MAKSSFNLKGVKMKIMSWILSGILGAITVCMIATALIASTINITNNTEKTIYTLCKLTAVIGLINTTQMLLAITILMLTGIWIIHKIKALYT